MVDFLERVKGAGQTFLKKQAGLIKLSQSTEVGEISHDVSGIKTLLCVYAVNLTKTVVSILDNKMMLWPKKKKSIKVLKC